MPNPNPNDSQTVPTHLAADPEVVQEAFKEYCGKDPETLSAAKVEITQDLTKYFAEAGDDMDPSQIKCISGTVKEKVAQIVKMNSRLQGLQQAMKQRADLLDVRQRITDGLSDEEADGIKDANEVSRLTQLGFIRPTPEFNFRQELKKALNGQQLGNDLRQAVRKAGANSTRSLTIEMDVNPHDFMHATVSTGDGWDPEVRREAGYLPAITRPPRIADTLPGRSTTEHGIKYMILRDRWGTLATGAATSAAGVSITTGGVVTFGASAGVTVGDQIREDYYIVVGTAVYTITKAQGTVINVSPDPGTAVANAAWSIRSDSAALERAEGGTANEATLKWVERSEDLQEIAVWIPVTVIQMEDEAQIEGAIQGELNNMMRQRIDVQSFFGSGTDNSMFGMFNTRHSVAVTNHPWTKASSKRSDQMGDLLKAQDSLVEATMEMYVGNVYYMARPIWTEVALKDTSGSGYYLGSPAGTFQPVLWGLPIIPTGLLRSHDDSGTIGAALVDTSQMTLWTRRGITMEMGLIDRFLIQGKRAIVLSARMALEVRRPQAVVTLKM